MQLRKNIESHLNFMKRLKEQVQYELKRLPIGTIVHKKSKGYEYQYYQTADELINIKKHPEILEQDQLRKELVNYDATLQENIKLTEEYMERYIPLTSLFFNWDQVQSESNHFREETKLHVYKDVHYRSKSELAIAMFLHSFEIEFKYESSFQQHGHIMYPDFYIKRPKDNKIFIWEHFGMTHDTEYRNKIYQKLIRYHNAGFNLWDNLIISFDKENGSIDADYIETIIKLFLL